MQRVLVAGATGYLGGFVAQELKARGYFVRALVRSPKKLDHLWDSADEILEGEVTRPETLEHVCDGIDVVFSSIGITRHQGDLLAFFTTMATPDVVAPSTGTHTLEVHFRALCVAPENHPMNLDERLSHRTTQAAIPGSAAKGRL